MGMVAIWFSSAESFEQTDNAPLTCLMWNLVKIGQTISVKKTLKDNTILYMYIAHGAINPQGINFDWN